MHVRQLAALLLAALAGLGFAQQYTGTFADAASGISIALQQGGDGSLTGALTSSNGQFPLQGQASQQGAYGAIQSRQGVLGFQAQLSPDGQWLQITFFELGPDGQPSQQGQTVALQRQGGAPSGAVPGQLPPQAPGQFPGQPQTGFPGQQPGQFPGQQPGQLPGQLPPQAPGQFPGQPQTGFPGQQPGQVPGQVPGQPGGQQPPFGMTQPQPAADWTGTFVGNAGKVVLSVSGNQGGYVGYLQDEGQRYQFQAHLDEATLHGMFTAGGAQYEFWVDRDGQGAMLYVGDTTFVLQQVSNQPTP